MTLRTRRIADVVLPFAIVALALAGCTGRATPAGAGPDEVVLKSHAVPEGVDAVSLQRKIQSTLGHGDARLGTALNFADGSLVVTAPASIQDGVAELIQAAGERGLREPETPPSSVSIRYWAIVGRPNPEEGGRIGDELSHDEGLRPALDEILAAHGPLELRLVEELQMVSGETNASIRGGRMAASQRVVGRGGGRVLADVEIHLVGQRGPGNELTTRVSFEPGRYVVIGQSGYGDGAWRPRDWEGRTDLLLFYVMSAEAD